MGLLRFLWLLFLKESLFLLKQGEKQLGTTDTLKMFEHLQEEANTFFKYYEKHLEQQLLSKSLPQAASFAAGAHRSAWEQLRPSASLHTFVLHLRTLLWAGHPQGQDRDSGH